LTSRYIHFDLDISLAEGKAGKVGKDEKEGKKMGEEVMEVGVEVEVGKVMRRSGLEEMGLDHLEMGLLHLLHTLR